MMTTRGMVGTRMAGFTLIQLTLIGVLGMGATVGTAYPWYMDYQMRSRMALLEPVMNECKASVIYALARQVEIPDTVPSLDEGHDFDCECGNWNEYYEAGNCSEFVSSVYVNGDGVIELELLDTIGSKIDNGDRIRVIPQTTADQKLGFMASSNQRVISGWTCEAHPNPSYTFDREILPAC